MQVLIQAKVHTIIAIISLISITRDFKLILNLIQVMNK